MNNQPDCLSIIYHSFSFFLEYKKTSNRKKSTERRFVYLFTFFSFDKSDWSKRILPGKPWKYSSSTKISIYSSIFEKRLHFISHEPTIDYQKSDENISQMSHTDMLFKRRKNNEIKKNMELYLSFIHTTDPFRCYAYRDSSRTIVDNIDIIVVGDSLYSLLIRWKFIKTFLC